MSDDSTVKWALESAAASVVAALGFTWKLARTYGKRDYKWELLDTLIVEVRNISKSQSKMESDVAILKNAHERQSNRVREQDEHISQLEKALNEAEGAIASLRAHDEGFRKGLRSFHEPVDDED